MKVKILMTILSVLCLLVGGWFFIVYSNEDDSNLDLNNLGTVDKYLYNNFSFALNLNSEKDLYISCDPLAATTTSEVGRQISYLCKNQDVSQRVLIGWVPNNETNIDTLQKIGNAQLSFSILPETGTLSCVDSENLLSINKSVAAGDCAMTTESGKKLYSSTVFLKFSLVKDKRFFVTVMNVGETTSQEDVNSYLNKLLSSAMNKKQSKADSFFIEKAYAGEGGGGGGGGSCSRSEISCSPATDNNGNSIDVTTNITKVCVQIQFGRNDAWDCKCPAGSYDPGNGDCLKIITVPPTVYISVSPSSIPYGGSTNSVSYSSDNATACSFFDNFEGSDHYAWSINGAPLSYSWGAAGPYTTSHTYTVVCVNKYGTATKSATLSVGPPPAVNCVGAWSNNSTCSVNGACGQSGSLQQVYSISTNAANGGAACPFANGAVRWGSTSCSTAVCVPPPPGAPTVNVNGFNPPTITAGQTSTFGFTSTNATACYATGNIISGNLGATSYPQTAPAASVLSTPGTYTLGIYCTGAGGTSPTVTRTLTVNSAASFSCTGTTPANATIYASDDSGLAGNTAKSYSATNSGPKCQYSCNSGYSWNGSSCVAQTFSCTGTIPANASFYSGDNSGLTANIPMSYSSNNNMIKCEYSCNSSYTWNGSSCVGAPPSAVVQMTASPNPCTIPLNGTSCNTSLSWDFGQAAFGNDTKVYSNVGSVSGNNVLFSTAPNGTNVPVTITPVGRLFSLSATGKFSMQPVSLNGTYVLNATANCASGSAWDGSKCAFVGGGNTTLSVLPASCVIQLLASTCTSYATWNIDSPSGNYFFDGTKGSILSYDPSGSNVPVQATYPNTLFGIANGGTPLSSLNKTVTTSCVGGSIWNGKVCGGPALPDLVAGKVTPLTATVGVPVTLKATITNVDTLGLGSASTGVGFPNLFQTIGPGSLPTDPWVLKDLSPTVNLGALGSGNSAVVSLSHTFTTENVYKVRLCTDKASNADVAGVINEVYDHNNCGNWQDVTVNGTPKPDLVASPATVSAVSVVAGGSITFGTGNITNSGNALAGQYTVGGFYIDNNNDGNADYTQTAGNVISNTTAGNSNSRNGIVWNIPANAPAGTYRVSYIADVSNVVSESNEGNNFSGWTSFTVTAAPSGEITASPCNIAVGDSSCDSTVTWSYANFLGTPTVYQNTTTFALAPSGSVIRPVNETPGNRTFWLKDIGNGGSFAKSFTAVGNCVTGSTWLSTIGKCVILPEITAAGTPNIIRSGKKAGLVVTVKSSYDLTCTFGGGASGSFGHTGGAGIKTYPTVSGTLFSNILTSATVITVTCTNTSIPDLTGSAETRINVIPTVQEI